MKVKLVFIFIGLFVFYNYTYATIPERTGWWKFDDPANLKEAESGYGKALSLVGTDLAANGPEEGNGAVLIGPGSYYKMNHQIASNGGGTFVNEYTLLYDFMVPEKGVWHSFFQTALTNDNDGDFFINPAGNIGVGAVGYSSSAVHSNEWYRLIISVKNGSHFTCYLDGNLLMIGNTQEVDGRCSLDSLLLIFADENAEDANIYCSELSIWDQDLNSEQAKELGGFGHDIRPTMMTRIPYLQAPQPNSMVVCWHDTAQIDTKVEYGVDSTLGSETAGTCETVIYPYIWHTAKLTGLQPNTRYFYKVESGGESSKTYSFKTLPDTSYHGKLRFLILGDTHAFDTAMPGEILRAARNKISEEYDPDIENGVNGILHSGDIVVDGGSVEQYTTEFLQPLSVLSTRIPTMVVAGNHEGENPIFYDYLKLDDLSAYPNNSQLNEKIWRLRVGNSLFIGLNTNITDQFGETEAQWLDSALLIAEKDKSIDFVFLFFHHPPFSELWYDVITFDGGPNYVKNTLFPIIEKYTKVQQINYGHTHGLERGTIHSEMPDGDFRMICGGGSGGPLDPWNVSVNHDYNDIHKTYSEYFFQILEIDIANHSYQNSVFSLGTIDHSKNSGLLDTWYKKKNQLGPDTPTTEGITISQGYYQFNSSEFSGTDSIMSVQLQVIDSTNSSNVLLDTTIHWTNIYGVDKNLNPIDKNLSIDLSHIKIKTSLLPATGTFFFRVRYRDHNLKWSNWSNSSSFFKVGINNKPNTSTNYYLNQNYPNPFRNKTTITYGIPEMTKVDFRIYNACNIMVDEINEGIKIKGTYQIDYDDWHLNSGVYFYKMITDSWSMTKKMIKI